MNKVWIAAAVLVLVLGISITGMILNINTASDMTEFIKETRNYVEKDDFNTAAQTMETAVEELDNRMKWMLVFVSHGKLDEIEETILVAQSFLKNKEIPQFMAECERALSMLDHYREVEYPYFNNVF